MRSAPGEGRRAEETEAVGSASDSTPRDASQSEFEWFGNDAKFVVVPEQEALAVYLTTKGEIVIRRMLRYDEYDDVVITLHPVHAVRFAEAILEAAGADACVMSGHTVPVMEKRIGGEGERPKDRTGAERQKRFRQRQRNAKSNGESVTARRDGVTLTRDAKSPIAAE